MRSFLQTVFVTFIGPDMVVISDFAATLEAKDLIYDSDTTRRVGHD